METMEFKGTRGKWIGKYNEGVFIINHETKNEEPVFETGCGCCTSSTLDKYDALLISKAPEMLEMLKGLSNDYDIPHYICERINKLIKEATEL